MNASIKKSTAFCLAVFVSLILAQVSFAEVGRLKISNDVKTSFEAYKFNPNYNYYLVNQENNPCAVVGIGKDYAVHDPLLSNLTPGSDQFKKVIELVKRFPMASSPAFGARILDSNGNSIGEYYSTAAAGVTLDKEMKSIMLTIFMAGSHHN
jgi:hypothetical protein